MGRDSRNFPGGVVLGFERWRDEKKHEKLPCDFLGKCWAIHGHPFLNMLLLEFLQADENKLPLDSKYDDKHGDDEMMILMIIATMVTTMIMMTTNFINYYDCQLPLT